MPQGSITARRLPASGGLPYRRGRTGDPVVTAIPDMSSRIIFDPIRIDTGSSDSEGRLAYRDGRLIGVLTLLDPELHGELGVGRHWFLEAGFGPTSGEPRPPAFPTLDAARAWLADRSARSPCRAARAPEATPRCAAAGRSPSGGWCGTARAPRR